MSMQGPKTNKLIQKSTGSYALWGEFKFPLLG